MMSEARSSTDVSVPQSRTSEAEKPAPSGQTDSGASGSGGGREVTHGHVLGGLLVLLFVLGWLSSPTFATLSNFRNVMMNVSILGMLALGMTAVMLLREIDLSVGSLMAFAPIAAVKLSEFLLADSGSSFIVGGNMIMNSAVLVMALTLLVSCSVGYASGLITVKGAVPSVIVTLGLLFTLRGASHLVSGGRQFYFTELPAFMWLGSATVLDFIPVSFVVFATIALLSGVVLRYTVVGPRVYATGGNRKAAIYSGVTAARWTMAAFVFSGFCAGVAALIFSSRLGSAEAGQAAGFELSAIAIAVVGGTTLEGGRGTMFRTVQAAIILALVSNIIALRGVVVWYQTIIVGGIIVAAGIAHVLRRRTVERSLRRV